jgi:hypothetical protein
MMFSDNDKAVGLMTLFGQSHACCCNPKSSFKFSVRHLMVFNVNKEKLQMHIMIMNESHSMNFLFL